MEDDEFEDEVFEDDEELGFEKNFEEVFASGCKVYFLEANGSWWTNTCKTPELALKIVENFKK